MPVKMEVRALTIELIKSVMELVTEGILKKLVLDCSIYFCEF